jgi:hypothetical protein
MDSCNNMVVAIYILQYRYLDNVCINYIVNH